MKLLACPELDCDFDVADEPNAQAMLLHHLQGFPHYFYRKAAVAMLSGPGVGQ